MGLAVHNVWSRSRTGQAWAAWGPSHWIDIAVTNVFVAYGWLLFFYPMDEVLKISKHLFY
jgi:hypothetical protein